MRESDRTFLAEGRQAVAEALEAGRVVTLFHTQGDHADLAERARALGTKVVAATEDVLKHLTSTVTPQGVVAVCSFLDVPLESVREPRLVAVLCAVRDPGNAGTILRSADAAGADAVVFAGESVDVYNPKTVRASAGSVFHLPVVRGPSEAQAVEALRGAGLQILAADAQGEMSLDQADLTKPTAWLFGNEAWGLPAETAALADATVRIPMRGRAESLNLAAAATLLLFESSRAGATAATASGSGSSGELARWVSGSAHDLRSPLTGLTGFTKILLRRGDRLSDEQRTELLTSIEVDGERVGVNIKRVIDAARGELGTLKPSSEPIDLRDVARAVTDALHAREIQAGLLVPEDPVPALADAERLYMSVLAFAEAAAWWAEGQDPPRVTVEEPATVTVTRAGPAGPWPFTPEGDGRGIGVGLLAARAVVAAHGGTLEETLDERGLRFVLQLH
jgi:TrmH family RNA methyltransferase